MTTVHRDPLVSLARHEAEPAVSLFLPCLRPSSGARQEPVRLRNLLRAAAEELRACGVDEAGVHGLLRPAFALLDDETFWAASPGGLALFLAPGRFELLRVDFAVPELVRVGGRFAVRPLLPLLERLEPFYVLALSVNRVRLVEVAPDAVRTLDIPGLPASFDDAMDYVEYESEVSYHSASPARLGRRPAIFHGHADGDEENRADDLRHYGRRVLAALERGLPDPGATVVPAAVGAWFPMLREVNRRLHLAGGLEGNPDDRTNLQLAIAARAQLAAARSEVAREQVARWWELLPAGRSVGEIEEVVRAAAEGRIETLLLARGAERWGAFAPELSRLELHEAREPGDEELLDLAAGRTLALGGTVLEQELARQPERRAAAAILRWPAADEVRTTGAERRAPHA
jgi:hypothetical protein